MPENITVGRDLVKSAFQVHGPDGICRALPRNSVVRLTRIGIHAKSA